MRRLVPCSTCRRHVKVTASACPFCAAKTALGLVAIATATAACDGAAPPTPPTTPTATPTASVAPIVDAAPPPVAAADAGAPPPTGVDGGGTPPKAEDAGGPISRPRPVYGMPPPKKN